MKKLLLILFLIGTSFLTKGQVLTQVYVDPCSGKVLTVTVPLNNGTVTIVYRGMSKVVTADDITSGALTAWITMVNTTPCPAAQQATTIVVTQAVAQATAQATAAATQAATQAATSAATSSATTAATTAASSAVSTPAPTSSSSTSSGGGGETKSETKTETNESKSDSKEETKSESKSEKKSEEKKSSSNKAAARLNPIIYSSDLTLAGADISGISAIISLGMSQSSLMGNVSWGVTSMIWSTFNQFALSARYTKMGKSIMNFGLTGVYLQGTYVEFATAAVIRPLGKYGVTGFNYALTYTDQFGHGLMAFYTKPITFSKRLTISPDIYLSNSLTEDIGILTGASFDIALTKRFKFNFGLKTGFNTNPDVPMMYMSMIGTKINL
jgi:hypothetical protein